MTKIAFVIPYYGSFPSYYKLFLKSCERNPSIDWYLVTDIPQEWVLPENVHRVEMSFESLKVKIQSKLDFEIVLDTPYKLCDYRPAYGYIFEDLLKGYDFWGYCDLDLLFGDLRKFLKEEYFTEYDKIGHLGHLTLFRNKKELNRIFLSEPEIKNIYSSNRNYIFDEWGNPSINRLLMRHEKKVLLFDSFLDIYPYSDVYKQVIVKIDCNMNSSFLVEKRFCIAQWVDGSVFKITEQGEKEEFAYVHFQKRNIQVLCPDTTCSILCAPDYFTVFSDATVRKAINWSQMHSVIDNKKVRKVYNNLKYSLIEKTGPIRHKLRKCGDSK